MTFQAWVDALVESRYGGRAFRLAEAVGLHQSSFSRGAAKGTLSVESLLKLAQVTGEPPGDVLRLAGKDDVADLLDDLYGTTGATVSRTERRVIQAYRVRGEFFRPSPALLAFIDDVRRATPALPPLPVLLGSDYTRELVSLARTL